MAEPARWPGLVPARARRFAGGPIECRGVCRNLVGVGQALQQVVRAGFSVSNRRATRRSGSPSAVKKRPDASRALPDRRLKITMSESPDSGTSRSTRWPGRDGMRGRPICSGRPRQLAASWPLKGAGGPSTITLGRVARAHRAAHLRSPHPHARHRRIHHRRPHGSLLRRPRHRLPHPRAHRFGALQKLNGRGLCLPDHTRRACVIRVAGGSTPEI